ncbi:MAG: HU family DNA-binding protein [Rhodocyclaceae bacterium]
MDAFFLNKTDSVCDIKFYRRSLGGIPMIDMGYNRKLVLEDGEEFKVQHFGKFSLIDKKERPGRNPKTGEPVPIDARRVVVFTPSKQLKDGVKKRLNNKNYDDANDAEMQNFYAKNY